MLLALTAVILVGGFHLARTHGGSPSSDLKRPKYAEVPALRVVAQDATSDAVGGAIISFLRAHGVQIEVKTSPPQGLVLTVEASLEHTRPREQWEALRGKVTLTLRTAENPPTTLGRAEVRPLNATLFPSTADRTTHETHALEEVADLARQKALDLIKGSESR